MGRRTYLTVSVALASALVLASAGIAACTSTDGLTSGSENDGGQGGDGTTADGSASTDAIAQDGPAGIDGGGPDGAIWERYRAAVMADDPVGYWRFEEQGGTKAKDETGANDGTFQGGVSIGEEATYAAGGRAVRFAGTNGSVPLGSVLDFGGKNAITLEAWVNLDLIDTDYRRVIAKRATGQGYSFFCHTSVGGCAFELADGPSSVCNLGLTTGQWFHIVGTYDGVTIRGFVDGSEVCNKPASGAFSAQTSLLVIGAWPSGGNYLKGAVDEVAIYETALAPARVKAHYQAMTDP